jgi:hypothetical protein
VVRLWAKFIKVFLVFMVFISSFLVLYPVKNAEALGWDTAIKIAAGTSAKQVVRGIAEKAGMKLAGKQLDNVVGVINKKALQGDVKAVDFVNRANALTGSANPARSGFKKYLLDPAMWLTGLDLIVLAYQGLKAGLDSGTPVEQACFGDVSKVSYRYNAMTDKYQKSINFTVNGKSYYSLGAVAPSSVSSSKWATQTYSITSVSVSGTSITVKGDYKDVWTLADASNVVIYAGNTATDGNYDTVTNAKSYINNLNLDCSSVPILADVPDITNVNSTIINTFNNDTYNIDNITYNMEIDAPDYYYDDSVTVWNEPDTNIPDVLVPPVAPVDSDGDGIPDKDEPDTDGDGIIDDTDITPNGDTGLPTDDVPKSLWDKLFPVLLVIKLFGLLGSALMYLVRMFAFIMTIPGIDAIPIDNPAFVWFRSSEIIGIKIYDVVSSLAGVGLSFIVFRAIRRAFL